MKKNFNFLLMAALVCGLNLGVTSCKSDDSVTNDGDLTSQVTVDPDLLTHGVEIDIKGGTVNVPIEGKGSWIATITDADWVGISNEQATYSGKQTLTLVFDRNLTGVGRRAQLVILDENGLETAIPIYQNTLYNGQEPGNSSSQWFSSKGLGHGVNYDYILNLDNQKDRINQKDSSTNLVTTRIINNDVLFNFRQIEDLQKKNILPLSAYTETPIEISDMRPKMIDEMVHKEKFLSAEAHIGIELGILNVSADFTYGAHKREDRAKIDYNIVRQAPMYNVTIAHGELSAYAWEYANEHYKEPTEEDMDAIDEQIEKMKKANLRNPRIRKAELTASQLRLIDEKWMALYAMDFNGIFSMCFSRHYGELAYWEAILTSPDSDEAQRSEARKHCNQAMQKLDEFYGPFFISQAEYGGSFNIMCKVDTSFTAGKDTISGSVTAGLVGIGDLSGGIRYTSEGSELFRKSNCTYQVFGGNANEITSALFSLTHGNSMTDYEKWSSVLNGWIDGMRSTEDARYGEIGSQSHAELLSFTMSPIWSVMPDNAVAEYARAWFINKYWDKGILAYLKIMESSEEFKNLQEFFDLYLREKSTKPNLGRFGDDVTSTK